MRTDEFTELDDDRPRFGTARRYGLAAFALACVAVIVIVAVVARNSSEAPAQLRIRQDSISVRHGSSDFAAAEEGEDLKGGDVVRSDPSGQAQIEFFDGSVVRIDADTQLTLRQLDDLTEGRNIALQIDSGRAWHRVEELTSTGDSYSVRLPNATVRVHGTTFMTDCRQRSTCYVVGFDGSAEVESSSGVKKTAGDGDCIRTSDTGLESCDEKALGLVDTWVKENLADDQQLALRRAPSTPRATPSPEPTSASRGGSTRPAPRPVATPSPSPSPTKTKAPKSPTPEPTVATPTRRPHRTPKPTDVPTSSPGATACPTGDDGNDC